MGAGYGRKRGVFLADGCGHIWKVGMANSTFDGSSAQSAKAC
jgi:hypothetical protein